MKVVFYQKDREQLSPTLTNSPGTLRHTCTEKLARLTETRVVQSQLHDSFSGARVS